MTLEITSKSKRLFAILISGAASVGLGGCEAGDRTTREDASAKLPPIAVTAPELDQAYDDNEAAAQQTYGNKPLLVTGTVTGITLDFADDPVVAMRGMNEYSDIQLSLAEMSKAKAASVKKGTELTLSCEGVGEVIGTPILNECNFVSVETKKANAN